MVRSGRARWLVLATAIVVTIALAACGSDTPAEQPTATAIRAATATPAPSPSPTPLILATETATPSTAATATPVATPTQSLPPTVEPRPDSTPDDDFTFDEPEFPGTREFYILTNVDGGPLLLPYLDATAALTEYSFVSTFRRVGKYDDDTTMSIESTLMRTDGVHFYTEILEHEYPDDVINLDPAYSEVVGLQIVGGRSGAYGRLSSQDRWVDVSDALSADPSLPDISELPADERPVGASLFQAASSIVLASFGVYDPEDIQSIVETAEFSPLFDFKLESTENGQAVIAHRLDFSESEEFEGVTWSSTLTYDVVFTVDTESGLILHAIHSKVEESSGGVERSDTFVLEYDVDPSPPVIDFPQPGDPSIETDPDKIAAFLELFE